MQRTCPSAAPVRLGPLHTNFWYALPVPFQVAEVVQAYKRDFAQFEVRSDGSWACVLAVRARG